MSDTPPGIFQPTEGPKDPRPAPGSGTGLEPVKREVALEGWAVVPKTLDDQIRFAKWALESRLLPDGITTVAQAWMILERGGELGFNGLAAFDFLYTVGGRVRITPDGVKAKALASGLLEDFREEVLGQGDDRRAVVTVKRRGIPTPIVRSFSVADAKTARLWGKVGAKGPSSWVTYPDRMQLARARGFAYGDAFRDLTGGLPVRERYDLEPGEAIGGSEARAHVPLPASSPGSDPLLDELSGPKPEAKGDPPFASHAEADAAIAEADRRKQAALFPDDDDAEGA